MSNRRGGLGRGLNALIPTGPAAPAMDGLVAPERAPFPVPEPEPEPLARFREIAVDAVVPNPRQPRKNFKEEKQAELKDSIEEVGLLQPIVVRQIGADRYELVMGERRWRACVALHAEGKLDTVPAIVRETADDAMLRDALLENLHRQDLNPLEEAAAYQQLLAEFGATHDELARRLGVSRPHITNTIRLLNLPGPVQRRVAAGVLTAGHARALLGLDDPDRQEDLASRIVAEGLSVRATEELVTLAQRGHADEKKKPVTRGPRLQAPGLDKLADRLSDRFDTRVKVEMGKRKGRVVVEFANVDDLDRIVKLMERGAL